MTVTSGGCVVPLRLSAWAAGRENRKWATIGNHAARIAEMKSFLQLRINWMTNNLGSFSACQDPEIPPLVITKINYAPDTSVIYPVSNDLEFIEISNTGNEAVNMTGIYFSGTGFVYNFNVNRIVEPHESIILAGNSEVFRGKYGFYPYGQFTRSLSNTGEKIVLADGFGNVIDIVEYSDLPPWPDAKFNGLFLSLSDPHSDNNIAANWTASTSTLVSAEDIPAGQDIKFYPSPVTDILRIESATDIMYLELYDIMGTRLQAINVNSVYYSLDMTSYAQGLYLVKVFIPGGSFVRKIIRQ
jgi:hypothetical protein